MKVLVAFTLGVLVGAGGFWYLSTHRAGRPLKDEVQDAAESTRQALEDKLHNFHLGTNDISEELARTGQVIRQKAQAAGKSIADGTADARITATIKAKLITTPELSGWNIAVSTTAGVVTLSGAASSVEAIKKAMEIALATDGVHQVISTLQVRGQRS